MSQAEPTSPYVYQPGRAFGKTPPGQQKIFGVGGPGTDHLIGERFTREEAEQVRDDLILRSVGSGGFCSLNTFLPG